MDKCSKLPEYKFPIFKVCLNGEGKPSPNEAAGADKGTLVTQGAPASIAPEFR
jgi:hypothetical protein